MTHKVPLIVYILWHPSYRAGHQIATNLYSVLCRNSKKPLVRGLGIPVYFRFATPKHANCPIDIPFEDSVFSAVIALVSDEFVVDNAYSEYLEKVFDYSVQSQNTTRIYPVACSKHAFNISKKLAPINFVRIEKIEENSGNPDYVTSKIKSAILHELCRLLMNMKRATDEKDSLKISAPIKLFISHSKHDDSKLVALKFRDFINSQTQLKTFFDANDIAYGSNFGDEIKKAARESALVVFQSDSYSDREWCRIEVLTAKSAGCPIVIVNAIERGEKRAFPYLGNSPSIRYQNNFSEIIDLTLEQVLFNQFTKRQLDSLTDLYNIRTDLILSSPPELLNLVQLRQHKHSGNDCTVVLYPDPPLGSEELDILNQLDEDLVFVTPTLLPSLLLNSSHGKHH